jgi:hypothetical protein
VITFVDFEGKAVPLEFGQVRRLMFNPTLSYFTLFYNEQIGSDAGALKRLFVTIRSGQQINVGVKTANSGQEKLEQVDLQDLRDYVSPLLL